MGINPKIRAYMRAKAVAVLDVICEAPAATGNMAARMRAEDRRLRELAEAVIQLCDENEAITGDATTCVLSEE